MQETHDAGFEERGVMIENNRNHINVQSCGVGRASGLPGVITGFRPTPIILVEDKHYNNDLHYVQIIELVRGHNKSSIILPSDTTNKLDKVFSETLYLSFTFYCLFTPFVQTLHDSSSIFRSIVTYSFLTSCECREGRHFCNYRITLRT